MTATVLRSLKEGFIERLTMTGKGRMLVATLANDRLVFFITNQWITIANHLRWAAGITFSIPLRKSIFDRLTLEAKLEFSLCEKLNNMRELAEDT